MSTEVVENRREDLVRAAARLFRAKGFDGTTTRDIAAAVGMRSGSPFYHFANKHELLLAVMEHGLQLGLQQTEAVLARPALSAVERFRALVRVHFGILHGPDSDFVPVMLYDWRALPDTYRSRIVALKDRYDAVWQRALDELHAQGRLRTEPHLARLLILGAINFSVTWYREGARGGTLASLDAISDETVALVLHDT